MSSTPTQPFVFSNSSDDDTHYHHFQQRESSPCTTSSSISTKQNSLLTIHDVLQMTPHESEVETMIFSNIQQQEAAETRKSHCQSPLNHNTRLSMFQCIPDESLRFFIGKSINSNTSPQQTSISDDDKGDEQHYYSRHDNTTPSISVVQKPDSIERRSRSDNLNHSTMRKHQHRTTIISQTPLRSNRTTASATTTTSTPTKHLRSTHTRPKDLPPLARSSTITSSNNYHHRHVTTAKKPSQLRHRHSNSILTVSSTGTTLASMAQLLDEFQNNKQHPIHEPFHSTSPSSSSQQSKILRQNKHPTVEDDAATIIPSSVECMIVPSRLVTEQRPISTLASKDYNVLTSSCWSLNDSDDDSNDKDSLLLNPKSPPQDEMTVDLDRSICVPFSNNSVTTTSMVLTTEAVSDWIKNRKPTNITVTTVEQDSDANDNDDDDDRSMLLSNIKSSSDDGDDVEWGKTIRNLLSPTSVPVSPHTNKSIATASEHLAPESRIIQSKDCCRRFRCPMLQFPIPTSLQDLLYDFEIFIRQRQKIFFLYLRYLLLIVTPAIIVAFVLFYIAGKFAKSSMKGFDHGLFFSQCLVIMQYFPLRYHNQGILPLGEWIGNFLTTGSRFKRTVISFNRIALRHPGGYYFSLYVSKCRPK